MKLNLTMFRLQTQVRTIKCADIDGYVYITNQMNRARPKWKKL